MNLYIYLISLFISSSFESSLCSSEENFLILPGSYITLMHSKLVKICGTIALGTFGLAILLKVVNVISFLTCPLKMLAFKQKIRNF